MPSSVSPAIRRSPSKIPYSSSFHPRSWAIVLRWMLWSLFPVKYWSPAPQLAGSRTRMSACIRASRITVAFVSPARTTSFTRGIEVNARIAVMGSGDVTRRSRSPTASRIRRALPAIAALSMRAWSRMYARISSPIGHATAMRVRDCPSSWSLIASRIFCSVFSPNPFSRRIWRFSAARFRSLMSVIPIVFHSMLARFGPRPRSRITSTSPFGNSRWSLSSASTFPSRRYWSIFSAIACPTPGSCKSRSTPPCRRILGRPLRSARESERPWALSTRGRRGGNRPRYPWARVMRASGVSLGSTVRRTVSLGLRFDIEGDNTCERYYAPRSFRAAKVRPLAQKPGIPADILQFFRNPGGHSLIVKGSAGTGKTTFALQLTEELGGIATSFYLSTRVSDESLYNQFSWLRERMKKTALEFAGRQFSKTFDETTIHTEGATDISVEFRVRGEKAPATPGKRRLERTELEKLEGRIEMGEKGEETYAKHGEGQVSDRK